MNGLRLSCSRFSRAAGSWLVRGRRSSGSGSSGRSSGLLASVSVLLGCLLVSSAWASPYAAALPCESQPAGCPSTLDGLTSMPNDPTWTTSVDPEAVASFHATATPTTETSTPIATTAAPSPGPTRNEPEPRAIQPLNVNLSEPDDFLMWPVHGSVVTTSTIYVKWQKDDILDPAAASVIYVMAQAGPLELQPFAVDDITSGVQVVSPEMVHGQVYSVLVSTDAGRVHGSAEFTYLDPAQLAAGSGGGGVVELGQDWEDLRGFVILAGLVALLLLTVSAVGAWRR